MLTRRSVLRRALIVAGSAAASLLAACSQPAAPAPSPTTRPAAPTAPPTAPPAPAPATSPTVRPTAQPVAAAPTSPPQAAPTALRPGGKLIVALEADPIQFDTTFGGGPPSRLTMRAIYDPLVELDVEGNLQPGLLEKWELASDTTYLLHVRPGVKFHDGTPLDAEAVKFHFDRHLDPATNSTGRSELGPVDRIETAGPMTVKVTLKEAFAPFLYSLFDRTGFVISPTAYKKWGKDDYGFHPIGTGPFRLASYQKDQMTVVERNPDYWRKGEPLLDEITFRAIPVDATRLTELRSGGAHLAQALPFQDIQRLKAMPEIVVSQKAGFRWDGFMYNSKKEPWTNKKLRQALNWALDREAIQKTVYFDTGQIGYDAFLPGTPFFDPNYKPFTRDLDKAKKLLDESGAASTVQVKALIYQDQPFERALQIAQANYAEIGVKMSITVRDVASVLDDFRKGNYEFSLNWYGYRPDPDSWINAKYHSKGSNNFYGFYSNPEVDDLIVRARQTSSLPERVRLYRQVATRLNDDAPHIFFHYGADIKGLSPKVKGFVHFADAMIRWQRLSLG